MESESRRERAVFWGHFSGQSVEEFDDDIPDRRCAEELAPIVPQSSDRVEPNEGWCCAAAGTPVTGDGGDWRGLSELGMMWRGLEAFTRARGRCNA